MELEILRAELERLFELDELLRLCRDLLGFDPAQVGGTEAKASFAGALTQYCSAHDAVEALCDAMLTSKQGVNPKIAELSVAGSSLDEEIATGKSLGPFTIQRKLGEGRLGVCYVARRDGKDFRIKVLRREATRDARGLHRFLTLTRIVATVDHAGLPHELAVGVLDEKHVISELYVEGQPLAARVGRTGPLHLNEARPLITAILAALVALHTRKIAHGDLRLENVLVHKGEGAEQQVLLLDGGSDRLRARPRVQSGRAELFATVTSVKTASPEQIQGFVADTTSDVYSLGAMLYELLTGKSVFGDTSALEAAFGHATRAPAAPSTVAPRGWIPKPVDDFVLALLAKDPKARPADAQAVSELFERLNRGSAQAQLSDAEVQKRIDALHKNVRSADLAVSLEAAAEEGAPAEKLADAFVEAAKTVHGSGRDEVELKKGLLLRAARLLEREKETLPRAEGIYLEMLELNPNEELAGSRLEEVRRKLGKFEELIEMLLARSETSATRGERARAMSEIGRLYLNELSDREQALVAFTQAFCEDPRQQQSAEDIERLAGSNQERWAEVLSSVGEASTDEQLGAEEKNLLLNRCGAWYTEKLGRLDLAIPCFQAVVATDAANDAALAGMTEIYRRAQQWPELGMVLQRRADASPTPAMARDLRAEAADIIEHQMNDVAAARTAYEQILEQDPGHGRAGDALARIYERTNDQASLVKLLERRAKALRGEEQLKALCRVAEIYEDHLGDSEQALKRYESVLEIEPRHAEALRGLDRVLSKLGRYQEVLDVLKRQTEISATPRQKITLWERIAGIYDEEFLDHAGAAEAWEKVFEIDSAHEPALTALVRHYRAVDRWEKVVQVYDRHLKLVTDTAARLELALALGRVLTDQIGSPERATKAYEVVLSIEPEHPGALDALAKLRETAGDADAALTAIDALAERAGSPEAKAEQYVRAAKLCDSRGDRDGAIERYKRALDVSPKDVGVAAALRAAYAARGDINAAIQLIEREIEQTDGDRAKAKLAGEMARLARNQLKDDRRAEEAAKKAVSFDPTNPDGLTVLGDIAFENKRYLEAIKHYEPLTERANALEKKEAVRLLVRYVDALSHAGSTEKALAPVDTLLRLAPDDAEALERVAQVTFEHGAPKRAAELYNDYLTRFGAGLDAEQKAVALGRYGEALLRSGAHKESLKPLEEAAELDPSKFEPLEALAKAYEALENWEQALKLKTRLLDAASGEKRAQLLMEIGDIAAGKTNDRALAAKSYVAALDEHPDDRRILTKLMQLYSEEKDWGKLVDVVLRLAEFVEDPAQKVKYLSTAAIVTARQMGDLNRAFDFYEQVLELDPKNVKAIDEAIDIKKDLKDFEGMEPLLKKKLEVATIAEDQKGMLETFGALGELYETSLGWIEQAIDAYEAAQTFEPDNSARNEKLSTLYASDPAKYLDKAVAAQLVLLRENPYRPEPYKLLRRLYTEVKRADAAWCLCQALVVQKLAEPDEERFYNRMRPETAAPARAGFTDEDWLNLVMHQDCDPLVTSVFALIEPAVIATRSQSLAALGFEEGHRIDPSTYPYPLAQNLHYAAGVIGIDCPPIFQNTNDPGGLSFLHTPDPGIVMGHAAHAPEVPAQAAAFVSARQLTYFRPGFYLRHLVPTGTGLKSWLFAAIKLTAPQFPVAAELEGPVTEAVDALKQHLDPQRKDHLTRVVSKLLTSGVALDLKQWVASVDLTADRAGFVVGHDLESVVEVMRASDETSSAVAPPERLKEIVLYAISEPYLVLRQKLSIGIDS